MTTIALPRGPGARGEARPETVHVDVSVTRLAALPPEYADALAAAATSADRDRVAGVPDPVAARRTLLARGLLRVLLAERLGVAAAEVELVRGPDGKPALKERPRSGGLAFNLSHSRDVVVVALTRRRAVGVDVEAQDPGLDVEAIARRFFPTAESAALLAAPPAVRRAQFFRSWCRKEALLKAEGTGMRQSLGAVSMPSAAVFAHRPVPVPGVPGYGLVDLDVVPGFACAVVAEGRDWTPTVRRWPDVSTAW